MNNTLFWGLLGGFVSMFFLAILYMLNPANLLLGYEKITWVVLLAVMVAASYRQREMAPEKFISFYEVLQTAFRTFVVAYAIKFVFTYVLFNFIDPSLVELARDKAIEIFKEHRDASMTEELFSQQLEAFRAGDFGPRILDIGVMLELIIGFIFSLIVAAILRRDEPDYSKQG